jgi:glycosyltransferase involved in cell wall biosynthesis
MRAVLVYRNAPSPWASAQTIRTNLQKLWHRLDSFEILDLTYGPEEDWEAWSKKINSFSPDFVVFLASLPVPIEPLETLSKMDFKKRPAYVFHIYGDFTVLTHRWIQAQSFLRQRNVLWLAASPAQQLLLQNFLGSGSDLRYLPFPVDDSVFQPPTHEISRGKDFKIFYTGRFSRQKNSLQLLIWLTEYMSHRPDVTLELAGDFHDFGAPFWGIYDPPGWTYKHWSEVVESIPASVRSRIRHHGMLDANEVSRLAQRSDCYVSLSTHHDEDFGMAPLEAIFCGSRAILSGWGGFSSFAIDADSVSLVPVTISKRNLKFSMRRFFAALERARSKGRVSIGERELRHLMYSSHFSIDSLVSRLEDLLKKKPKVFCEFRPLLKEHANLLVLQATQKKPIFTAPGKIDGLYEKIYRCYRYP